MPNSNNLISSINIATYTLAETVYELDDRGIGVQLPTEARDSSPHRPDRL
jgi:hypothetical protein